MGLLVDEVPTRDVFPPNTLGFPSQYPSTDAPCSFIHLSQTLYNISN